MFDLAEVLLASAGASAQETDEAVRWLRKSASHGFVQAQSRLGSLLSDGISIKPDYLAAWVWYTLAAAQGDRVARMDARRLERRLTADQLESARQRVEQFGKPSKP
jgi:TPR repeat protein